MSNGQGTCSANLTTGVWIPRNPHRYWVGGEATCNSSLSRQREGDPQSKLASSGQASSEFDWQIQLQWIRWNSDWGWFWIAASSLHLHTSTKPQKAFMCPPPPPPHTCGHDDKHRAWCWFVPLSCSLPLCTTYLSRHLVLLGSNKPSWCPPQMCVMNKSHPKATSPVEPSPQEAACISHNALPSPIGPFTVQHRRVTHLIFNLPMLGLHFLVPVLSPKFYVQRKVPCL